LLPNSPTDLSFGVEGGNGALVAVGPTQGWNGIVSYFWHGGQNLGNWNRIVCGSTQGLDNDISDFVASGAPDNQLAAVYSKAMIYSLQVRTTPSWPRCRANFSLL
jgi:hypothetical protein